MAILKCKMCGGDIQLSEDKTTGTCDHCGSTMTFPRVSDEQKLNLYNRANHFRRQNEFDKAITAYERILDQDDTDAEAHWGAVLSRYGIEYVEDPATHERIPTCHRVQYLLHVLPGQSERQPGKVDGFAEIQIAHGKKGFRLRLLTFRGAGH